MQDFIARELAQLGGQTACVVLRINEDAPECLTSLHPDAVFPAASLAKLPILVEVARHARLGLLDWETRYAVTDSARVPSDGVLNDLSPALRPTLHDLAHLMIAISDNTASNMLLDLVGMASVNATMLELGLSATRLERRFVDWEARRAGRENWTSAGDMALLLSYFCMGQLPAWERLLGMLLRQNDYTILPAYWGEDVPFAHKTGGLAGIIHDAGILYPPLSGGNAANAQRPIIIVVMTSGQEDVPFTRYVLARIGRIIYNEI